VNDAEQEAARIRAVARTEAEEESTRRRDELADEVRDLETDRERLGGEISALEGYLSEQRSSLGGALDRIRAVLDDPSALRLGPPPAGAGRSAAPSAPDAVAEPEPEEHEGPATEVVFDDEPDAPGTEAPPSAHDEGGDAGDHDDAASDAPRSGGLFAVNDPTAETPGEPSGGEESEGSFGEGDEEADAAMRRFFEADFGDDQRFGR
jgi:hypothetical protein